MRESLVRDVRYAVRGLARSPGFAAVAILTLALGVGATTSVFTMVNGVLLQPLPYKDPERLVNVWNDLPKASESLPAVSPLDARDYREQATLFEGFGFVSPGMGTWGILGGDEGEPERVELTRVSANFLPLLGVKPILGRQFTADDEVFTGPPTAPTGRQVVMLSYGLWQRRYAGDPQIVGRRIMVDGVSNEVVAVLPKSFRLHLSANAHQIKDADLYKPVQIHWGGQLSRSTLFLTVIARLKPGVTLAQAQGEMDGIAARLRAAHKSHEENGLRIRLVAMQQDIVKGARPVLLLLFAAAGTLLLIACANVASLLLARAAERERELAVRLAMGASRWQLAGQLLAEGLVLGLVGAVAGVVLAAGAITAILRTAPANLPRLGDIRIEWVVLGFAVAASVLTAVLFALAPAVYAARRDAGDALKGGARVANAPTQTRFRSALIVGELALSLVLLAGAGLLIRSFVALQNVRPGFDPENVLTFQLSLPMAKYATPESRRGFSRDLEARLRALPGVVTVGAVSQAPFTGKGVFSSYSNPARPRADDEAGKTADVRNVTPGYFETFRTRLRAGRLFTQDDDSTRPPVVIVDEQIARELWPNESPIGKQFRFFAGRPDPVRTVVGVVEHVRLQDLAHEGSGQIYIPYARMPWPTMMYTIRTRSNPGVFAPSVRRTVASIDRNLAPRDVVPLTHYLSEAAATVRFSLVLIQTIGLLALTLAGVGLYGVVAYAVGRRTREFGVRMALGATPSRLTRSVVGQGLKLIIASSVIGLAIAAVTTRLLDRLLYGVTPLDAQTFAAVLGFLTSVAVFACYVPARRAGRVAPAEALRAD